MTEPIYIVCTGPSLIGFDFEKLRGKKTIAVNLAIFSYDFMDYIAMIDGPTNKSEKDRLIELKKEMWACSNYHSNDEMFEIGFNFLIHSGANGYDKRKGYCKHGFNSGYLAVQLALDLGYKEINILGMDATYKNGSHYYDTEEVMKYGLDHLPEYMSILKKQLPKDVNIYNYSINSSIKCFPFKSLNSL